MNRIVAIVLALAIVLAACNPPPAQPDPRIAALEGQVTALSEQVEELGASLNASLRELTVQAVEIVSAINKPINLADVDFSSLELLVVTTRPEYLDFLLLAPGECPVDLPLPSNRVYGGDQLVTVAWPAPTGPHCLSYANDDVAFGTVVNVPAGSIGGVTLLAPLPSRVNVLWGYLRTWGIDVQAMWMQFTFDLRLIRALWRFRNGR